MRYSINTCATIFLSYIILIKYQIYKFLLCYSYKSYLQGQGQDEDSEAEKLSPLLDAATSTEALDNNSHGICDIDIDDEMQNTENENDVDITCHSH